MSYIGNYAYTCKLGTLAKRSAEAWLKDMEKGSKRVTDYAVTKEQRRAWTDCFQTLQECAVALPKEFRKLDVVFEYVLPNHQPGTQKSTEDNGIRADVLLISDKTVMVLEFKRRGDVFMGHVRQARKYRTRIQKFHKESIGMNKKTILVLTAGEGIRHGPLAGWGSSDRYLHTGRSRGGRNPGCVRSQPANPCAWRLPLLSSIQDPTLRF